MSIQFSDLAEQALQDATKILSEDNGLTNGFKYITGLGIIKYLADDAGIAAFKKFISMNEFSGGDQLIKTNSGFTDFETIELTDLIDSTLVENAVFGGNLSRVSDTELGISALICLDDTGAQKIQIDSAWVKATTGTFSTGSGSGGLDTGTFAANNTYYVFAIYNDTTKASDIIFSLSSSSPTPMPSGFTHKKLIGSLKSSFDSAILVEELLSDFHIYNQYGENGEPYPEGFLNDFNLNLNGTDLEVLTTTNSTIASDVMCRDYTNSENIQIVGEITKDTTATFVAGDGGGCLAASLVASTHYFIYAICKSGGKNPDIYINTADIGSVSLPGGYQYKQIIGYAYTDGSTNLYLRNYRDVKNPLPPCHIDKIEITYEDTDEIGITQGACRDCLSKKNIFICYDTTKLTSAWTEGSGNGALADSLTLAVNTQYYVWVIGKYNENAFDFVINTTNDYSSFVMPANATTAGYTTYQLIAAFRTEISATDILENSLTWRRPGKWLRAFLHVQDVQSSGTNGGNTVATTWTTRNINTINEHSIPGSSVNTTTNTITLPKGYYSINIFQMVYDVDITGRVYNNDLGTEIARFSHTNAATGAESSPILCTEPFYLDDTYELVIQYYAKAVVTNGLGLALNAFGLDELFLNCSIEQIENPDV